ncbi:MAG TPA: PfkB family carbohydrate kinase [Candidatus Dormibacteraeota bacterium]|jgi:sugar/nucleoside kinase (ribokinase family)|nr:PfkB family carbohydrate kinase [Candidatus Dormibacteraeota bacterium]
MLAAIGNLFLDVTIVPAGELRGDDDQDATIRVGGGGQAANFCAWAVRAGARARLLTMSGGDVRSARGGEATGVIAVLVGAGGRRGFLRQRGASAHLREEDVDPAWLDGVRLLHVPAECLLTEPIAGAARRAVSLARARPAQLSIDLSSAAGIAHHGSERFRHLIEQLAPDVLFATEAEETAIGCSLERLAPLPVRKLGARGCRVGGQLVEGPEVDVLDGTGAGDALAAGFCAARFEGAGPVEAASCGVRLAEEALGRLGGRP